MLNTFINIGMVAAVLVLIVLFIVIKVLADRTSSQPRFPYHRVQNLLSPAEQSFYLVLKNVVEDPNIIFSQVSLNRILKVVPEYEKERKYLNKISQKSVDFVLVNKNTMGINLVIELDDSTHDLPDRYLRDFFVNSALEAAGIKYLRIKTRYSYKPNELKALIEDKLSHPH